MGKTRKGKNDVTGANLSEPHTSESNDAIFMYIIYLSYVFLFRVQFNATVRHVLSISNIFALQSTFQHEQCVHSFPMGENGEESSLGRVAGT